MLARGRLCGIIAAPLGRRCVQNSGAAEIRNSATKNSIDQKHKTMNAEVHELKNKARFFETSLYKMSVYNE